MLCHVTSNVKSELFAHRSAFQNTAGHFCSTGPWHVTCKPCWHCHWQTGDHINPAQQTPYVSALSCHIEGVAKHVTLAHQMKPLPRLPLVYTLPLEPPSHAGLLSSTTYFSPVLVTFIPSRYRTCARDQTFGSAIADLCVPSQHKYFTSFRKCRLPFRGVTASGNSTPWGVLHEQPV